MKCLLHKMSTSRGGLGNPNLKYLTTRRWLPAMSKLLFL